MKNINQLFRRNPGLLDEPEVKQLIEYTQDLEGQVMENKVDELYLF
jgi:hypothetical protein